MTTGTVLDDMGQGPSQLQGHLGGHGIDIGLPRMPSVPKSLRVSLIFLERLPAEKDEAASENNSPLKQNCFLNDYQDVTLTLS
jgi:hypothetical protein